MPTSANALAVMAKAPVAGLVKTRLMPPLDEKQAAELYRALLIDQLEHLTALSIADLYVAFTPGEASQMIENLAPAGYHCFPQAGSDLGDRMQEVLAELRRRGHRNAIVLGSDLPPVPLTTLHEAFKRLSADRKRVVLGPSQDGGYYLIGMNQPTPEVFFGMSWSHQRVLADTTEKLRQLGIDFCLLPHWLDVDTAEDLARLRAIRDPLTRAGMKRTLACLEQIVGVSN
jgi:rSAM/selenodomain-associated transferase 1